MVGPLTAPRGVGPTASKKRGEWTSCTAMSLEAPATRDTALWAWRPLAEAPSAAAFALAMARTVSASGGWPSPASDQPTEVAEGTRRWLLRCAFAGKRTGEWPPLLLLLPDIAAALCLAVSTDGCRRTTCTSGPSSTSPPSDATERRCRAAHTPPPAAKLPSAGVRARCWPLSPSPDLAEAAE